MRLGAIEMGHAGPPAAARGFSHRVGSMFVGRQKTVGGKSPGIAIHRKQFPSVHAQAIGPHKKRFYPDSRRGLPQKDEMKKTEIFVMLPMDIVTVGELSEGKEASFIHAPCLNATLLGKQFEALREGGASGVMLDVWWGICERHGPQQYDFTAYMELFKKAKKHGMKVQAVMSFHQGGGNVGDGSTYIPLPPWVQEAGEAARQEIFYTDKNLGRDREYISLGCDHLPVLAGRTPLEVYADFVHEFCSCCSKEGLWGTTVTEICVGCGPCGELRYPAYQEDPTKWSYFGDAAWAPVGIQVQRGIPGIGELQCYDQYMLADLKEAAEAAGNPEWGQPPRDAAGTYNSAPWETEFFALTNAGGWLSPYGRFFMEWYSGKLIQHGADVLDAVLPSVREFNSAIIDGKDWPDVEVAVKVAGIHWWYKSRSHAAEMTAGYYNHLKRCAYDPIAAMLKERGAGMSFTCIEMLDSENPDERHCSPEGLVAQVIGAAEENGVPLMAENALEGGLWNQSNLDQMLSNSQHFKRITLLRLRDSMFEEHSVSATGLRVKMPLRGFLAGFRREQPSSQAPATQNGAPAHAKDAQALAGIPAV
eukprot:jgi/Botrbrau1/6800/Bobra.0153s0003.1